MSDEVTFTETPTGPQSPASEPAPHTAPVMASEPKPFSLSGEFGLSPSAPPDSAVPPASSGSPSSQQTPETGATAPGTSPAPDAPGAVTMPEGFPQEVATLLEGANPALKAVAYEAFKREQNASQVLDAYKTIAPVLQNPDMARLVSFMAQDPELAKAAIEGVAGAYKTRYGQEPGFAPQQQQPQQKVFDIPDADLQALTELSALPADKLAEALYEPTGEPTAKGLSHLKTLSSIAVQTQRSLAAVVPVLQQMKTAIQEITFDRQMDAMLAQLPPELSGYAEHQAVITAFDAALQDPKNATLDVTSVFNQAVNNILARKKAGEAFQAGKNAASLEQQSAARTGAPPSTGAPPNPQAAAEAQAFGVYNRWNRNLGGVTVK